MKNRAKQPLKAKKVNGADTLSRGDLRSIYSKSIDSTFKQFQKVFVKLGKSSQLRDA